jgi:predicted ATPase
MINCWLYVIVAGAGCGGSVLVAAVDEAEFAVHAQFELAGSG